MIRLESKMLPESITICYCCECRKAYSNPFLTFGLFYNDYVQWSIATPSGKKHLLGDLSEGIKLTYYSGIATRGWCPRCGTPLFMKYHCRPDGTNITMGLVDDEHTIVLVGTYVKERDNDNNKGKVVRLVWYSGLRSIYLSERDTGEARILI